MIQYFAHDLCIVSSALKGLGEQLILEMGLDSLQLIALHHGVNPHSPV